MATDALTNERIDLLKANGDLQAELAEVKRELTPNTGRPYDRNAVRRAHQRKDEITAALIANNSRLAVIRLESKGTPTPEPKADRTTIQKELWQAAVAARRFLEDDSEDNEDQLDVALQRLDEIKPGWSDHDPR